MSPHEQKPSGLSAFLAEMRRRHVVRFALGYAAAAFVLLQLAEIIFPAFGLGETALRILVIGVVLAFPPAVVLAWVFDLTTEGLKRTEGNADAGAAERAALTARVALVVVSFLVLGGLGGWLVVSGTRGGTVAGGSGGSPGTLALTEYDPNQPITSVAVLPLDDFSEGGGQEYFTAGMQEELITQLSQVPGLRVVSRTSVARYTGGSTPVPVIGRELGVDAIIEGSVVRSGERVRITVQLIHAASDTHVWSQRYDRDLTDVLTLQSEVAYEIVEAIQGELTPEEEQRLRYAADKDVDPVAQDAYLRGKQAYAMETPEGLQTAMAYFQDAVAADPTFAGGWAGLAGTRVLVSLEDSSVSEGELELAHQEALRAIALDTMSQEAREVVRSIEWTMGRVLADYETAQHAGTTTRPQHRMVTLRGLDDSIRVDVRGLDTAWVASMTRLGSALEERVRRLPTLDGLTEARAQRMFAARRLMSDGLYGEARVVLGDLVEEAPELEPAWEMLVKSAAYDNDVEGLVGAVTSWSASGLPGAPTSQEIAGLTAATAANGIQGYWRWQVGRLEERAAAGDEVSPVALAAAYSALNRPEEALQQLTEGLRSGDRELFSLGSDPVWDNLRRDPRFQDIARRARELRLAGTGRGQTRR